MFELRENFVVDYYALLIARRRKRPSPTPFHCCCTHSLDDSAGRSKQGGGVWGTFSLPPAVRILATATMSRFGNSRRLMTNSHDWGQ